MHGAQTVARKNHHQCGMGGRTGKSKIIHILLISIFLLSVVGKMVRGVQQTKQQPHQQTLSEITVGLCSCRL